MSIDLKQDSIKVAIEQHTNPDLAIAVMQCLLYEPNQVIESIQNKLEVPKRDIEETIRNLSKERLIERNFLIHWEDRYSLTRGSRDFILIPDTVYGPGRLIEEKLDYLTTLKAMDAAIPYVDFIHRRQFVEVPPEQSTVFERQNKTIIKQMLEDEKRFMRKALKLPSSREIEVNFHSVLPDEYVFPSDIEVIIRNLSPEDLIKEIQENEGTIFGIPKTDNKLQSLQHAICVYAARAPDQGSYHLSLTNLNHHTRRGTFEQMQEAKKVVELLTDKIKSVI